MSFTCTVDPAEAKTWFAALTDRRPCEFSIIASVSDALLADPDLYTDPRFWAGRRQGEVVAAYMHTRPHEVHIARSTPHDARQFAAHLAETGHHVPGVGGPRDAVLAFAAEWSTRTPATARTVMEMGVFDLPARPALPFPVSGQFRTATTADLELANAWAQDFADSVSHVPHVAASLEPRIDAGRVGLWEEGGRAVSMAYASPVNGGVTRVSGVWTPPALRGRGFASGVVAGVSAARMDAGERCMLYTDLANATSNAIYQAIGYRRIGENRSIAFDSP